MTEGTTMSVRLMSSRTSFSCCVARCLPAEVPPPAADVEVIVVEVVTVAAVEAVVGVAGIAAVTEGRRVAAFLVLSDGRLFSSDMNRQKGGQPSPPGRVGRQVSARWGTGSTSRWRPPRSALFPSRPTALQLPYKRLSAFLHIGGGPQPLLGSQPLINLYQLQYLILYNKEVLTVSNMELE